ncbi:MerR family transcriptional regulator [Streptomyces reniochalinae]|uniref:MerR family transcriptional regulator n=1 Tax=Streptomyces reniochalinae TaxID=2250578 RepID=UPI001FE36610|nr:MerR family transcriptional regulator [Streptomyces reniochalinae]
MRCGVRASSSATSSSASSRSRWASAERPTDLSGFLIAAGSVHSSSARAAPGPGTGAAPAAPSGRGGTFIGPLAGRLGIRTATLRKWQRAGLVRPRRDPRTAYRVFDEAAARDAMLTHQLRRGGYLLEEIAPLIAQVRTAGGVEPLEGALNDWHARLAARGRAMPTGAAALDACLGEPLSSAVPAARTARSG